MANSFALEDEEERMEPYLLDVLKNIDCKSFNSFADYQTRVRNVLVDYSHKSNLIKKVLDGETTFLKEAQDFIDGALKIGVLSSSIKKRDFEKISFETEEKFIGVFNFDTNDSFKFPRSRWVYLFCTLCALGIYFAVTNNNFYAQYPADEEAFVFFEIEAFILIPLAYLIRRWNIKQFHEEVLAFRQRMIMVDLIFDKVKK